MKKLHIVFLILLLVNCFHKHEKLALLGNSTIIDRDKLYPKIKDFSFFDQNGTVVSDKTFKNKIYVADFIFLSCPTICPKMNVEMKKVYTGYKNENQVNFFSYTFDPLNDTESEVLQLLHLH